MNTRTATSRDIDRVLRIQHDNLMCGGGAFYHPSELERWDRALSSDDYAPLVAQGAVILAIDEAERVIGFARFNIKEGVIAGICVVPERQGEGVGRGLVRECLARARGAGLAMVHTNATLDTVEFYERMDFEPERPAALVLPDGTSIAMTRMSRAVELPRVREQIEALEESVAFFSPGKGKNYEKELIVVKGFITGLGMPFKDQDFKEGDDPPDVCFGEAKFEVKALFDEGRKMHQEYKQELAKSRAAFFTSELIDQCTPKDVSLEQVIRQVAQVVFDKGAKYPLEKREALDFLVYVNLQHIWAIEPSWWPDLSLLETQGWRSIAFTRGMDTSCVLTARQHAPAFLRQAQGKLFQRGVSG